RRTAASSRRFLRREDCLGLCRIAAGCYAPGSPAPRQIIASDLHRSRGAAAPSRANPPTAFLCAILSLRNFERRRIANWKLKATLLQSLSASQSTCAAERSAI